MLVITDADPRASDRALESLRMAVGLASGGLSVAFRAQGPARALLDPSASAFPDWRRAEEYLAALASLGGTTGADDGAAPDVVIRWSE